MQSLLRWSIEHSNPQGGSAPGDGPPASNQKLDPGIIDMILGKPDAEQMKEDVSVATDVTKSEDDRLAALDHLEMLVEHIDNANDLQKLNLWQPLLSLLSSSDSLSGIKVQVLWVIGTAVQNNPTAQDVYLACNPLPTLLGFLTPSPSSTLATRAKAIYTLSGVLKHNAPAVEELGKPEIGGWTKLREALQDPEISVRRKTMFLLNTLILPTTPHATATSQDDPPLLIGSQPASTTTPAATTSVALHTPPAPATVALGPSLHTSEGTNNLDPIHANSHAPHLKDPSRSDTSRVALEAFGRYDVLGAVISAVVNPLPFGEDGDNDKPDADFEEKAMHLLYTYGVSCCAPFIDGNKGALRQWIEREGGVNLHTAERWNLSLSELNALVQRLD